MSKPSAIDTIFRAVIMGSALGGIGWAAFRYTTLPQALVQRGITWIETLEANRPRSDAEPYPAVYPNDPGIAPHATATPEPTHRLAPPTVGPTLQPIPQPAPGAVQQARFESPDRTAGDAATNASLRSVSIEAIEERLRALGSVYSLLEVWGRDPAQFRFHSRVAVGGGGSATRSFEATGRSVQSVMQQVLADVEAWYASVGP